jgi:hypothetical protein
MTAATANLHGQSLANMASALTADVSWLMQKA